MRIIEKLLVLLLLLLLNASGPAQAMERVEVHPSIRKVLRLDPRPSTFRLPAPVFFPERAKAPTATIQVNYTNFTEAQRQAFQAAADIWGQTVSSTVPIVIDAKWAQLDPGVLGQSGPTSFFRNFANSEPNRWYAVSLANKLAGTDLDPAQADMEITFNTDYAGEFYYGVDGNPPADEVDFFTTILHEICHGLDFLGSFSTYNGMGRWGYGTGYPFIFDPLYYNGSNQQLINTALFANPSSALLGQMTSNNVFCKGIKAMQANGGNPVKIYAPATWKPGSSMSHWDEIYRDTPNALMCYALSRGASIHDPGPFTRGLLEDIGWTLVSPSVPAIGFAPATLSPSCQPGQNAASQTFEVWNSGGDALNYSISDNQTWLSCTPAGGTSTGERDTITVNYATSGLAAGAYKATITITASGASNTPQTIPVSLIIQQASSEWDVAADFSLASNPNGAWSYGNSSSLTGTLNLYSNPSTHASGIQIWKSGNDNPNVIRNPNSSPVTLTSTTWPAHSFSLHPGSGGEFSHTRWTCPGNGSYTIEATFSGYDSRPTSTDVHVLINGVQVFNGTVNAYGSGSAKAYSSGPVSLNAGQTVDFAVGYGANGNYNYDTTGLAVKIRRVNNSKLFFLPLLLY